MKIRIQKIIAASGMCSRRNAEQLIMDGDVLVNTEIAKIGESVDPDQDEIYVRGHKLNTDEYDKIYIVVNKPSGYEVVNNPAYITKTIYGLLPAKYKKLKYVGRLDKDSSGLILMSSDGAWVNKMMHPSKKLDKEYDVTLSQIFDDDFLMKMKAGVRLDGEKTYPATVKKLGEKRFSIVLHEGRNRQIRRMCGELGYRVMELRRVRIGRLTIDMVKEGETREIKMKDV